jgi:hypothetical protein
MMPHDSYVYITPEEIAMRKLLLIVLMPALLARPSIAGSRMIPIEPSAPSDFSGNVEYSSNSPTDKPFPQERPGFWRNKSKKKLGWGLGLLAVGAGAAASGFAVAEKTETKTERVTSSCGPGCTVTQFKTRQVTTSEPRSPGLGYAGAAAGLTGVAFLISYARAKNAPTVEPGLLAGNGEKAVARPKRAGSKKKLWWGLALMAMGGGAAVYGLSNETTTSQETRNVTVASPAQITADWTSSTSSTNFGTSTYSEQLEGEAVNSGSEKFTNVVINVTYTSNNTGKVLASVNDTIAQLPAGGTAEWFTSASYNFTGSSSETRSIQVSSAQVQRAVAVNKSEKRNPAMGYVGGGAALLGTYFVLSYLNSSRTVRKAEMFEIDPVFYAGAGSVYQGVRLTRRF